MKNNTLAVVCGGICLLIMACMPAACLALEGFVIPTIAFSHLQIEPGNWCEYLVIEESMGQQDSSMLSLSIPGAGEAADPGYFWFELKGQPLGGAVRDAVIVKLLLSEKIRQFSERDSLGKYVAAIYIKEGDEPVRAGDFEALSRLEQESAGGESPWLAAGKEQLAAGAGDFSCEIFERVVSYEKTVPVRNSKLITTVFDRHRSWFAGEVPLFQMVRYTAERSRNTRMDPPIAGVPVAGARASNTYVELVGFGTGAKTLLPPGD